MASSIIPCCRWRVVVNLSASVAKSAFSSPSPLAARATSTFAKHHGSPVSHISSFCLHRCIAPSCHPRKSPSTMCYWPKCPAGQNSRAYRLPQPGCPQLTVRKLRRLVFALCSLATSNPPPHASSLIAGAKRKPRPGTVGRKASTERWSDKAKGKMERGEICLRSIYPSRSFYGASKEQGEGSRPAIMIGQLNLYLGRCELNKEKKTTHIPTMSGSTTMPALPRMYDAIYHEQCHCDVTCIVRRCFKTSASSLLLLLPRLPSLNPDWGFAGMTLGRPSIDRFPSREGGRNEKNRSGIRFLGGTDVIIVCEGAGARVRNRPGA
jgi:hypothetical protein